MIVTPLWLHVGVQQPVDGQHVPVQQVVLELVQQVGVPFVQHVGLETVQHVGLETVQHTGWARDWSAEAPVGTGQHEMTCERASGHMMCGDSDVAPAGPAAARIQIAAAAATRRGSRWTIGRRIASHERSRDRR